MREITFQQALIEAMREEMLRDERVFLMGEDVGLYGGAYGASKGLFDEFGPERIRDTAISEAAIVGAGVGAALTGMRPIAEIMYIDFTGIAMDQIANQAAKVRYMFGGKARVPLVIRTSCGSGRSFAAQHSQCLEAWFMHVPGLYVVMPSNPYDAKGLLKTCIRDDNPVMFIEHKMSYKMKGQVPEEEYLIPLGQADVKRAGGDVTVIAISTMVQRALKAAEELAAEGIEVEVIDPRSLVPLDMESICNSVKKTGRVIVVHESVERSGPGAEIATRIMEEAFDYLDAPVKRLSGKNCPMPCSPVLEEAAVPQISDIIGAVKEII